VYVTKASLGRHFHVTSVTEPEPGRINITRKLSF